MARRLQKFKARYALIRELRRSYWRNGGPIGRPDQTSGPCDKPPTNALKRRSLVSREALALESGGIVVPFLLLSRRA